MEVINRIDQLVVGFIDSNMRSPWMDKIIPVITSMGGFLIWFIIAVIFMFFKKYRKYGIAILITLAVCSILGDLIIKNIVRRIRPCNVYGDLIMLVAKPSTYSFPSGHSMKSFASAVIVSKANKKFAVPSFILAFATAFSRIYLYVHYFTDTVVGAILGIICALCINKIFVENTRFGGFFKKRYKF